MKNPEESAKKMSLEAVSQAKEMGETLDFDKNSITKVERILEIYSQDLNPNFARRVVQKITGASPSKNQIWSMSMIWGSYIGESIIREIPSFTWVFAPDQNGNEKLHLLNDNYIHLFPIEKTYKRLTIGSEDNIESFFHFILERYQNGVQ